MDLRAQMEFDGNIEFAVSFASTRTVKLHDIRLEIPLAADVARYAMGLSDDLLTATLLASRGPVLLCPAMHTEMWEQPSVQENLATLRRRGVLVLDPETGVLAGGDEGPGRLPEPEVIFALVEKIVGGIDADDGLQRRGMAHRHLNRIEPAPGNPLHPHAAI